MNAMNKGKLVMMMVLLTAVVCVVNAQTGGLGSAAATAKQGGGKTLWDLWVVGGPVMWPIGLCSVVGIGLAIYCAIQYRLVKMARLDVHVNLSNALDALNLHEAHLICNNAPCMLTSILKAGLERVSKGDEVDVAAFEKAMEEASVEEITEWQKPLGHLSLDAQIAPMLGLLGTVTGMIGAFDKIGMGAMGSPEKLAGDIGEAMITTAAGLMVAIPCMFIYFFYKAKFTGNVAHVSRLLGNYVHQVNVAVQRGVVATGIQAEPEVKPQA
jgi:biopolymer transport protein ExbB